MKASLFALLLPVAIVLGILWLRAPGTREPSPSLECVSVGFDERTNPLGIGLKLVNHGDTYAMVNGLRVNVLYNAFLYDDKSPGTVPQTIELKVTPLIPDGDMDVSANNGEGTVTGTVEWLVPDDAPPTLAVCRVKLLALVGDEPLCESPVYAVVFQSEPGAMEKVFASVAAEPEAAAKLAASLQKIEGRRTESFKQLLRGMQAAANPVR